MAKKRKRKVRFFPGTKINDMYHYAILLLGKRSSYIILPIDINDILCKSGSHRLNKVLDLKNFTREKHQFAKKTSLYPHLPHTIIQKSQDSISEL